MKINLKIEFYYRKNQDFGSYQPIKSPSHVLQEPRIIPANILRPPYNLDALPPPGPSTPEIKSSFQIDAMRASCTLARNTLNYAKEIVKVCL